MSYTDEQIRAARRALSGQDEEPVVLETSMAGGGHTDSSPSEAPTRASAPEIVHELQAENPLLLEVLASRVLIRKLQQALAATPDTKGESEG